MPLSKILPFCCLLLGLLCILVLNLSVATADDPAATAASDALGSQVQTLTGLNQPSPSQ